jgi:hypothetical protein
MAQQRVIVGGWAQESKKSQKVVHYPTEKKTNFSNLRDLTKVEDMLFWDLPLLFV